MGALSGSQDSPSHLSHQVAFEPPSPSAAAGSHTPHKPPSEHLQDPAASPFVAQAHNALLVARTLLRRHLFVTPNSAERFRQTLERI